MFFEYATGAKTGVIWTGARTGDVVPISMDYDGDGMEEPTVYDDGAWIFFDETGTLVRKIWVGFVSGQLPLAADFDGDGDDDPTIYQAGSWKVFDYDTGTQDYVMWMGLPGTVTIPVVLDFDGDEYDNPTIYKDGSWRFYNDSGGYLKSIWVENVAGQYPVPIIPVKPLLP